MRMEVRMMWASEARMAMVTEGGMWWGMWAPMRGMWRLVGADKAIVWNRGYHRTSRGRT